MLTFFVPMLVMLLFLLVTLGTVTRALVTTTTRIIREDVDTIVATQLQHKPDPQVTDYLAVIDNVRGYLRDYSENTRYRKALMGALLWVFGAGLFIVIVETVLMTIYFSHRVAGPVYRFEKACHAVIDGDYTETIHLRKGDEMQNLARLINQANEMTRNRIMALRDGSDPDTRTKEGRSLKL